MHNSEIVYRTPSPYPPNVYSEEFRRAVVRLTKSRPAAHVAREVGISPETLLRWRRAMLAPAKMEKGVEDGASSVVKVQ